VPPLTTSAETVPALDAPAGSTWAPGTATPDIAALDVSATGIPTGSIAALDVSATGIPTGSIAALDGSALGIVERAALAGFGPADGLDRQATSTGLVPTVAPAEAPTEPVASWPVDIPPAGTDPYVVAAWWDRLPPDRQAWLLEQFPDRLGGLDGIPATVRDLANRAVLVRLLATPRTAGRADLLKLRDAISIPGAYLLGVDATGQGRAIVAYGDPDSAGNVVTYIPGMGSGLPGLPTELTYAGHLTTAMTSADPTHTTSVITWLGYDTPNNLVTASQRDAAQAAAPDLSRFQRSLHATHESTPAHYTVIGMSYGSLVVGVSAHGQGIAADDMVLIGSPGVGVDHAGDLGMPAGHVWASTSAHDVINAAVNPATQALRLDMNPLLRPFFGEHSDGLWFGTSPATASFGSHLFASSPGSPFNPVGAHTSYFDLDNPALSSMAAIATGHYGDIR
jgi:hypothetical protein